MPPPSDVQHLPPTHPAARQKPKSPDEVLAETEEQWIFSAEELANTPSIQDGIPQAEERELRQKGVNFIVQVGIMLKLPQLTLSTAAIFFQRFLMRASLKRERDGYPKLHHYQSAAIALFLATKVEESCRKMKELILACCRVAQKNPNLIIDEQSKDYWRWKDCILHNEDYLLEALCFDLTVDSPHRILFDTLKRYNVEHNKSLRNSAWGYVTDMYNTPLCLLHDSRTIAMAGLNAACRLCSVQLPDDHKGRPWLETQHVRMSALLRIYEYMADLYRDNNVRGQNVPGSDAPGSEGNASVYIGLAMDGAGDDSRNCGTTSLSPSVHSQAQSQTQTQSTFPMPISERRNSNASSIGTKRGREEDQVRKQGAQRANGINGLDQNGQRQRVASENGALDRLTEDTQGQHDMKHREEVLKVQSGNRKSESYVEKARATNEKAKEEGEGSEEGEVEE